MGKRTIRFSRESFAHRPALDTAISRALLHNVASGNESETLRLHRPGSVVAFSRQDSKSAGYRQAVQSAHDHGFDAIQRLVGGRAAVFHENTMAFAWTIPDQEPRTSVKERFEEISRLIANSLLSLGVDARVGEIPGEYCPGSCSVNARGIKKLMGVGQRLIPRAAHIGGVLVIKESQRVRDVLVPVYEHLGFPWEKETAGSIEDEIGTIRYEDVEMAIVEAFREKFAIEEGCLTNSTKELASRFESEHLIT